MGKTRGGFIEINIIRFSRKMLNSGIRNLFEKVEMIFVRWIFYCIKKLLENCEK